MSTKQAECPKCSGSGRIEAFSGIDNGKCFLCAGSGRVAASNVSVKAAARMNAACAIDALIEGLENDYIDLTSSWALHTINRAAEGLFGMQNTAAARKMLARCNPAIRAAIIARGREIKAA